MNVKQIFDLGVQLGIKFDPRGAKGIKEYLEIHKKSFDNLSKTEKEYFDLERLTNPYSDCRINYDNGKKEVKRILAGIDVNEGEILLASQLNERGKKIDLVIAHHPTGLALAGLSSVMDILVEVFHRAGVPVHVAEEIMEERIREVSRSVHAINHYKLVDLAKTLDVNFLNTHTITDNMVGEYLHNYITKRTPRFVGDLMDVLLEIPEYRIAKKQGAGPKLFAGDPKRRVGKFLVEMTGGTSPADKVYKELSRYGVSTLVGMHMRDVAREKAVEGYLNVVIAGHIASDSLGMNLFLDELEKKGIEIVPCGGLIRVSRVKSSKK